jgi:anaerobic selenocysteine-containing dehydrogenase
MLDGDAPPSTDELLAIRCAHPLAPLEEIKRHPSGKIFADAQAIVLPPTTDSKATFDVIPDDVRDELADVAAGLLAGGMSQAFTHLLSTRRMRNFYNSIGLHWEGSRKRNPYNPAYLNPADMTALGLSTGDRVAISSDHASIEAIVEADPMVRPGVISMAVAWGGLPGEDLDPARHGSSTNMLISTDRDADPLNAMPRMSAIPVNIARSVAAEVSTA